MLHIVKQTSHCKVIYGANQSQFRLNSLKMEFNIRTKVYILATIHHIVDCDDAPTQQPCYDTGLVGSNWKIVNGYFRQKTWIDF